MNNTNANLGKLFLQQHLSAQYGFCGVADSEEKCIINYTDASGEEHEIIIQHRKVVR